MKFTLTFYLNSFYLNILLGYEHVDIVDIYYHIANIKMFLISKMNIILFLFVLVTILSVRYLRYF
jgi:hypothetical protein